MLIHDSFSLPPIPLRSVFNPQHHQLQALQAEIEVLGRAREAWVARMEADQALAQLEADG